jgi:EAL domain-containing protein (putative c-di-GMP-specific phosphodiesterase class I)
MSVYAEASRTVEPAGELDRIIAGRAVRAVFQPLIDLGSGDVLAYEALPAGRRARRWSHPEPCSRPPTGVVGVAELDWACRAAAFDAAITAGFDPALRLFVNSEPVSLGVACPDELWPVVDATERQLHVVMEVTERAVARDPAGLLGAVARARAVGWGVALLDLRLIQGRTTAEVARIVNAVRAQAERTGAHILAEGIETRRHGEIARSMGATIGQGWLYGRPGPLPSETHPPRSAIDLLPEPPTVERPTPYEVVTAVRTPERAPKDLLLPMSMHIEHKALDAAEPSVLMACFQEASISRRPSRPGSGGWRPGRSSPTPSGPACR